MGTHPIFGSDFDCLTEQMFDGVQFHKLGRATQADLKRVFEKYSEDGEDGHGRFMSPKNFLVDYVGLPLECDETIKLLSSAIDTTGDGRISYNEFVAFEATLCMPDSLFRVAYQLFDQTGHGQVGVADCRSLLDKVDFSSHCHDIQQFNWECDYVKLYFGSDFMHKLNYDEFTQFIQGFLHQHAIQAFWANRKKLNGYVSPAAFSNIMRQIRPYQLTDWTEEHLVALAQVFNKGHNVNYAFFEAFNNLMKNMELVRRIYQSLSGNTNSYKCTKTEFMVAAQRISQLTPLEVEILFAMADLGEADGKMTMVDIERITPFEEGVLPYNIATQQKETTAVDGDSLPLYHAVLEQVYRFGLGVVAGIAGTLIVYPIDSVKTRLQNQKSTGAQGEMMYTGYVDCFKKVRHYEGVRALYNGLGAQCIGVGPEKAIKLTVNDFLRDKFRKDGTVPLPLEIVAGGCAGGCQVLFTNPLEIVKIRMQLDRTATLAGTAKEVGLRRLYTGASACLLRDIPFSAIYFPAYANLKTFYSDADGHLPIMWALWAGFLAGFPAAGLTTPADVIKTRLQAKTTPGEKPYVGLLATGRRIWAEEGFGALWKGAGLRMIRSPPQFAVTLFVYELLQRFCQDMGVSFSRSNPIGSVHKPRTIHVADLPPLNSDHVGGMKVAAATYAGIEHKFGLKLPHFNTQNIQTYMSEDVVARDQAAKAAVAAAVVPHLAVEPVLAAPVQAATAGADQAVQTDVSPSVAVQSEKE